MWLRAQVAVEEKTEFNPRFIIYKLWVLDQVTKVLGNVNQHCCNCSGVQHSNGNELKSP